MVRKQIILAIREIHNTLRSINLLTSFLDSLLVFLLAVITLLLISLQWYWALIPFIGYFIFHYIHLQKKVNLVLVEEKTPSLQEELRTSADNLDKDNEIVNALHEEVLAKMRNIRVSDFIDFRRVSRRLMIITLLSFLVLLFAAFNVSFLDVNDLVNNLQNQDSSRSPYNDESFPEEENREGAGASIFGEESIAELGKEELALQFNPVATELDLNQVNDPKELQFNRNPYTGELVEASIDRSFETDPGYVKENKDVVQRYFQGIATT